MLPRTGLWCAHKQRSASLGQRTCTQHTSASAYFKACFDDSDWQHENPRNGPGPTPQQHGLYSPWAPVLKEVLLQRVVGAEVEPHSRDGPSKGLKEQMGDRRVKRGHVCFHTHMTFSKTGMEKRQGGLTGEIPFHSPSSFSVLTTLRSTLTIPTLPELKEELSDQLTKTMVQALKCCTWV